MSFPPDGSLVWLIVCWFAVWRIAVLVTYDRGPFDILTRVRVGLARVRLHRLVTCFHCTALWVSLVVVGVMFKLRWISLVVALAVAGAASITERFLGGAMAETTEDRSDG